MRAVQSQRWAYVRIISGTILGGMLGFYLMHRAELSYKAIWDERLRKYQEEKLKEEEIIVDDTQELSRTSDKILLFEVCHVSLSYCWEFRSLNTGSSFRLHSLSIADCSCLMSRFFRTRLSF
ncbi:hypothetical protein Droror1_Dr00008930 [Drosera rotundifolia]